jgi:hypothetical protein
LGGGVGDRVLGRSPGRCDAPVPDHCNQ